MNEVSEVNPEINNSRELKSKPQLIVFWDPILLIPIKYYLETKDFLTKKKFGEILAVDQRAPKIKPIEELKDSLLLYDLSSLYGEGITKICVEDRADLNVTSRSISTKKHSLAYTYTLWGMLSNVIGGNIRYRKISPNLGILSSIFMKRVCLWFVIVADMGKQRIEYRAIHLEQIPIEDLLRVRFVKELFQNTRYAGPDRQRLLLAKYRFILGGVLIP